jgi:hypothetical protein
MAAQARAVGTAHALSIDAHVVAAFGREQFGEREAVELGRAAGEQRFGRAVAGDDV